MCIDSLEKEHELKKRSVKQIPSSNYNVKWTSTKEIVPNRRLNPASVGRLLNSSFHRFIDSHRQLPTSLARAQLFKSELAQTIVGRGRLTNYAQSQG